MTRNQLEDGERGREGIMDPQSSRSKGTEERWGQMSQGRRWGKRGGRPKHPQEERGRGRLEGPEKEGAGESGRR